MFYQIINIPGWGSITGPITKEPYKSGTVGTIIASIIPLILAAAGFLLLIMLIVSGYQLMASRGDPKALEGAKGRLLFALIGFFIVFGAYWILVVIQTIFKFEAAI
jgi:hypothetical protein